MINGWSIFFDIFEVLLVLGVLGIIVTVIMTVSAALAIKNSVMGNAKRLYEPPVRSAKAIGTTAKGVIQREQVHVQHIGSTIKVMAASVKEASGDVSAAAKTVHPSELKTAMTNLQNGLRLIRGIVQVARAVSAHQSSRP